MEAPERPQDPSDDQRSMEPAASISEDAFRPRLAEAAAELLGEVSAVVGASTRTDVGRGDYAALEHESHEVESFLDDHGARLNRRFSTLAEIVASMRSFASAGYALSHLEGRIVDYGADRWGDDQERVTGAIAAALDFVHGSCVRLGQRLMDESTALGLETSPLASACSSGPNHGQRQRLPHDIAEHVAVDDPQRVAEFVSRYLSATELLSGLGVRRFDDIEQQREFVSKSCREEQVRVYEATVHNLQSTYDTYIKNTVLESSDERLARLRGHASAALHLLEAATQLAHFHERHESDLGAARAAELLATLIDPDAVQTALVADLLAGSTAALASGRELAEGLLADYTQVRELVVELPAGVTLHARPVALIVGIVSRYGTPVEVEIGERRCDAGSILEVLMAVGSTPDVATFVFRGDERPLSDIATLFEHDLGEGPGASLPPSLAYLAPK